MDKDELRKNVEGLSDRLENGIRYDSKCNCYILVWTEKELAEARKEADRLFELFKPLQEDAAEK